MAKNEPQSYGSEKDWVTGETGQTVNPSESESSGDAHTPVQKVTDKERGAKRDSYWKDRDYKS